MKEIALETLSINPWTKIGKDWFLLTSGDENGFNTMTVAWANMGVMWNKTLSLQWFVPTVTPMNLWRKTTFSQ